MGSACSRPEGLVDQRKRRKTKDNKQSLVSSSTSNTDTFIKQTPDVPQQKTNKQGTLFAYLTLF